MPQPRHAQISLEATPYYHCVSRCVRRAFLCGEDRQTGRSFEHRKQWLVERMQLLAETFAIDICAYAVMSNHYHLVARINAEEAHQWSEREVIRRWARLYSIPVLVARYGGGLTESDAEGYAAQSVIAEWRERLADLSWFMRCLNEPMARWANAEDGCTGRFWEGRFKTQALLDEAALLTCMSYVDLNPLRAAIASTPEESDFTSIQARIRAFHAESASATNVPDPEPHTTPPTAFPRLLQFRGDDWQGAPNHLPFGFRDYLELVDWTARATRQDKRGAIVANAPPILSRLNIAPQAFLQFQRRPENVFARAVGRAETLRQTAAVLGRRFLKGVTAAERLFPEPGG